MFASLIVLLPVVLVIWVESVEFDLRRNISWGNDRFGPINSIVKLKQSSRVFSLNRPGNQAGPTPRVLSNALIHRGHDAHDPGGDWLEADHRHAPGGWLRAFFRFEPQPHVVEGVWQSRTVPPSRRRCHLKKQSR